MTDADVWIDDEDDSEPESYRPASGKGGRVPYPVPRSVSQRQSGNRILVFGAIGFSVLIAFGMVSVLIWRLTVKSRDIPVTRQRSTQELSAESVAVFSKYDGFAELKLADSDKSEERPGIEKVLKQLEDITFNGDMQGLQSLIDARRLRSRIQATGGFSRFSRLERNQTMANLIASLDIESYWRRLVLIGIVTPSDDTKTRVVYAIGWDDDISDQAEYRFWLARDDDSSTWKLYDWERLDLGLSESAEWGAYAQYENDYRLSNYYTATDLLTQADERISDGRYDEAERMLHHAERQSAPGRLNDFLLLLTAYRWQSMSRYESALACLEKVSHPAGTPGVFYSRMICSSRLNPVFAIECGEMYQKAVGPTPSVCETLAGLYSRLGQKEKAVETWKQALKLTPDHPTALSELLVLLDAKRKHEIREFVDRLPESIPTIHQMARRVAWRDYDGLRTLLEIAKERDADSPETLELQGIERYQDGDPHTAAGFFHRSLEATTDEQERDSRRYQYLEAMVDAGRAQEILESVHDPKTVFRTIIDAYEEGDLSLDLTEYDALIAQYRERFPDDPWGGCYAVGRLVGEEKYAEAETQIRNVLHSLPAEPAGQPEDETGRPAARTYLQNQLALVLFHQDRVQEAYESVPPLDERFNQLAALTTAEGRMDDLRLLLRLHPESSEKSTDRLWHESTVAMKEERFNDAARLCRQAIELDPDEAYRFRTRLCSASVKSGLWLEYYEEQEDRESAFRFILSALDRESSDPSHSRQQLIDRHRRDHPESPALLERLTEDAWKAGDHSSFVVHGRKLLASNSRSMNQSRQQSRLLHSLVMRGRVDEARQLAEDSHRETGLPTLSALLAMMQGDHEQAMKEAQAVAAGMSSADELYNDHLVGRHFLAPEFAELHEQFPVRMKYIPLRTTAVIFLDAPLTLEDEQISELVREFDPDIDQTPKPVPVSDEGVSHAFCINNGSSGIWLVSGTDRYDATLKAPDDSPLNLKLDEAKGWLAVGTMAWSNNDLKPIEKLSRHVAGRLGSETGQVAWLFPGHAYGFGQLFAVDPESLNQWALDGSVQHFAEKGIEPDFDSELSGVIARRDYDNRLRARARQMLGESTRPLNVRIRIGHSRLLEPLTIHVTSAKRNYGGIEFRGTIQNAPTLMPLLRTGLPVRLSLYQIAEWQDADGNWITRPADGA